MSGGWVGVDLDGTLAFYDRWRGEGHIGEPIPAMVARVKRWIAQGHEVRVFTARVSIEDEEKRRQVILDIEMWTLRHVGMKLAVTNVKDFAMIELWDDRAVQVRPNQGHPIGNSTRGL